MIRALIFVFAAIFVPAAAAVELDASKLRLASANVLVLDAQEGKAVYAKAADQVTPIASLTKLMTAMVVLDAGLPMEEVLSIDMDDFDYIKGSHSRLRMGASLTRAQMLHLALMSSENRAASALARHYPGGMLAFVAAMNEKAIALGMTNTHYDDSTGLSPKNVSTANDLAKLVRAASAYQVIRDYSTTPSQVVEVQPTGQTIGFNNSNALVKSGAWDIQLQKTGYIREAGRCVVMLVTIASKPMVIVLLDSIGKFTRVADAQRVKHWLETGEALPATAFKTVMKQQAPKGQPKRIQGKFAANKSPKG